MATDLVGLSEAVAAVVAAASPSVVGVGRAGSGAIVGDGLVLTNAHNLREEVVVTFDDGTSETARVAGADVAGDLAVLRVAQSGRPALALPGDGDNPALGQLVVGLSRPGGRGLRAAVGFVTGLGLSFRGPEGSTVTGALEHSAPLARGSSGGPLLGATGRLLAINTHREGDGLYLALPAGHDLAARTDALSRGELPRRARLGVALAPPGAARRLRQAVGLPPREGLLVHAVDPEGPAARAGLRPGDLIVSVGSHPVTTVEELAEALQEVGAGGACQLGAVRGADELTVSVSFSAAPAGEEGTA